MPDDGLPRFFVPPEGSQVPSPLAAGSEVPLPQTESHHAANVLRLREGAAVELFDGRGISAAGSITRTRKGEVWVSIESVQPAIERPRPHIHLAFAVPKGNRLDWLLEKATELGTASLQPVRFDRSVSWSDEFSETKRHRWLGHCIAAAKQAGGDWLPDLFDPVSLDVLLKNPRPQISLFGDLAPGAPPMRQAIEGAKDTEAILIVVGPEGGLTDSERAALLAAGLKPARLGNTTLRIETAAISLVAGVLCACG
jgi:16S rRNA (uracil1498-N3)-methyltransferase